MGIGDILGKAWDVSPGGFTSNMIGKATGGGSNVVKGGGGGDILETFGFGNTGKVNAANSQLEQNKQDLINANAVNQGYIDEYQNMMGSLYGTAPAQYQEALNKYMNADPYSYKKEAKDFFSPAYEQRVKDAMNNITKSQANAGNMFSSDYLNQLNAKSQAMASEEWDKAYDRMQQDRANALQEYQVNDNRLGNIASMLGQDTGKYADSMGNVYTNRINANNALTQGLTDLNTAIAQNNLQKKSGLQALLNPFGQ